MIAFFSKKQSTINNQQSRGFTLIELLVVIVIISILSTLLMANFIGVRQRGRDAQRKSDLRQIQAALELYRSDNGTYAPSIATCGTGVTLSVGSTVYMPKVPCDPSGVSGYNSGIYYYNSPTGNSTYYLVACLENSSDNDTNDLAAPPTATPPLAPAPPSNCASGKYYVLQNP